VDLVNQLAHLIEHRRTTKPRYLVGIDGPDAAGKTTLARHLAAALTSPVVAASIDGFHHPRATRHAPDRLSAEAFYLRSFNTSALVADLLEPFAAGASEVRTATLDYDSDLPIEPRIDVPESALLIVDGVFLQQPALRDFWDLVVYLDVPPALSMERGLPRDVSVHRPYDELVTEYERRYLPGQQLYRDECDPIATADIVIDNTDLTKPVIARWQPR
jgi:uridine kinase